MADVVLENELDDLSFNFFKKFALCECQIKILGHFKAGDKGVIYKVDWEDFCEKRLQEKFDMNKDIIKESVKYLCEEPPMKLIAKDKRIDCWKDITESKDINLSNLIESLKSLRNNLFHGSKYIKGTYSDPQRTKKLLKHGGIVLDHLLNGGFLH